MAISDQARERGIEFVASLTDLECRAIMTRAEELEYGFIPALTMTQNELAYFFIGMIMERLNYVRRGS